MDASYLVLFCVFGILCPLGNEAKSTPSMENWLKNLQKFDFGEDYPVSAQVEAVFSQVINLLMNLKYMALNVVEQARDSQQELDFIREAIVKEVKSVLKSTKGDAKLALKKLSAVTSALVERKAQELQMTKDEIVTLIVQSSG